ncbi:hypothetical protein CXB51_009505 [Gossypium anomalum]|uniref:CHY-type domain-containing protein n=1 Tax=Gossypium anomalum TaxID=47600 RepID=A0A8J6D757_9ROSI|nr:hypothetical protein CXB51_009505 [Gossypium anomalum]
MEGVCETKPCTTELKSVEFGNHQNGSLMETGLGNYGCSHYRRRCKIRAPCCNEVFYCRHCHNESKNSPESSPLKQHDIPRHEVEKVICSLCDTEQDVSDPLNIEIKVQQYCINCGVCMGKYFCGKCKFFDDDVSKNQYHCVECGICRTGGKENFFHCNKCGCCYSNLMREVHRCIEKAMPRLPYLLRGTLVPFAQSLFAICRNCGRKLDKEIASTPMPAVYQNKMAWVLCNDCGATSNVQFHIVAHKCPSCESYNTRQTRGGPDGGSCSEMVR